MAAEKAHMQITNHGDLETRELQRKIFDFHSDFFHFDRKQSLDKADDRDASEDDQKYVGRDVGERNEGNAGPMDRDEPEETENEQKTGVKKDQEIPINPKRT